jgi:hypothetical protein
MDYQINHLTGDKKLFVKKNQTLLFKGWWEHQGVQYPGRDVFRIFVYITGGIDSKIRNQITGTAKKFNKDFYIDQSLIPNAGNGVFTTKVIEKGEVITNYEVVFVPKHIFEASESEYRYKRDGHFGIGFSVKDCHQNNFGSMLNRNPGKNNCGIHLKEYENSTNVSFEVYATKRIVPRKTQVSKHKIAELYLAYGSQFRTPPNTSNSVSECVHMDNSSDCESSAYDENDDIDLDHESNISTYNEEDDMDEDLEIQNNKWF